MHLPPRSAAGPPHRGYGRGGDLRGSSRGGRADTCTSSKIKGRGEGTSQSEVQAKPWAAAFLLRNAGCLHAISPFVC